MPKVEVKPGETYTANGTKNGDGWSLFKVKAEKGRKEMAIFTDGSIELHDGDQVTVTKITGVKCADRPKSKDASGKVTEWGESWSVNAEVKVNTSFSRAGFSEEDTSGELPF